MKTIVLAMKWPSLIVKNGKIMKKSLVGSIPGGNNPLEIPFRHFDEKEC